MKRVIMRIALMAIFAGSFGCTKSLLPPVQPYPYQSDAEVNQMADELSANMTAYIKDWAAGRVPALLPASCVPQASFWDDMSSDAARQDTSIKDFKLVNPDLVDPSTYYIIGKDFKGTKTDWNALTGLYRDAKTTYLVPLTYVAPFGSTTTITGKFPYCRYFSIQPSPPFDPRFYYNGAIGIREVSFVDVDINPDSGSVNPFRVGANRLATNRNYTVTIQNVKGQWTSLMPDLKAPHYRMVGNNRYGSGIHSSGPAMYGRPDHKVGMHMGDCFIRYYAIDKSKGWDGGVPLPKMSCTLPSGEKFLVVIDYAARDDAFNKTVAAPTTDPVDPDAANATKGWRKYFSVALNGLESAMLSNGWTAAEDKKYVRDFILGAEGKGYNQPGPGGWESGASLASHVNYMVPSGAPSLGANTVITFTGKLPTFPNTRGGASTMNGAEMRYMSFTTYWDNIDIIAIMNGTATGPSGNAMTSVMDDDLVLDANRNYVLCYSRAAEKPSNATVANKVTWVDFGPVSQCGWIWRYICISPDWKFSKSADEANLTWKACSWSSETYDPNKLEKNDHSGFLGQYQPKIYTLKKSCFEKISGPVTEAKIIAYSYNQDCSGCGSSLAGAKSRSLVVLFPLLIGMIACIASFMRKNK